MTELKSIMKKPITIDKDASLFHVISKLLKKNISRLVITEKDSPVGIVSEKDIGLFLLGDENKKNLDEIPASQIMNRITSAHDSMNVKDCVKVMLDKKIGSLGVVSNSSGIVGIVTKTDFIQYYVNEYEGTHKVGDVMTISYVSANSDDFLGSVVSKMIDEKISRIFLKNADNEPEGILTFRDLFHVALEQGSSDSILDNSDPAISVIFSRKGFLSDSGFGKTIQAKEVMTKNIESVNYDEDLTVACRAIIQNKMNGIGVLINDKLSGVVSKTDILKAIYTDK